jgi:ABC-type amino acid transport substrate-binding protein
MAATPKLLRVGSAFPDPPFEVSASPPSGLDVDLTRAIAAELGMRYERHRYEGTDFEGIYKRLDAGAFDVVASGATITAHRETEALFCPPYLRSGQSLVVNVHRDPAIRSTADVQGRVIGVQDGNTSQPVAEELHRQGAVRDVKVYAYDEILNALDDVESGAIAGFMKLEPVLRWLTATGRASPSSRPASRGRRSRSRSAPATTTSPAPSTGRSDHWRRAASWRGWANDGCATATPRQPPWW